MAARIRTEQPLFAAFVFFTLLFLFLDLGTEALVQFGFTKTQIGGDMCRSAFNQCWAIALVVANAGGRSLVSKLSGEAPALPEVK